MRVETQERANNTTEAQQPTPIFPPYLTSPCNIRGWQTEQRVAGILRNHPFVDRVLTTERDGADDSQMIDLIVGLSPGCAFGYLESIKVQVKSSKHGVKLFNRKIGSKLTGQGYEDTLAARNKWLVDHKMIVINGGDHVTDTKKTKRQVTDEEIKERFVAQLRQIDEFKKTEQSS